MYYIVVCLESHHENLESHLGSGRLGQGPAGGECWSVSIVEWESSRESAGL